MGKTDSVKQGAVRLKTGVTSHLSTFFIGVLFIVVVIMFVVLGAFTFNVEALIPVATTLVALPVIGNWFLGFVSSGSWLGINWYTVSYMVIAALGMWYLSKRYYVGKAHKLVEVEPAPTPATPEVDPEEVAVEAKRASDLETLKEAVAKQDALIKELKEKTASA